MFKRGNIVQLNHRGHTLCKEIPQKNNLQSRSHDSYWYSQDKK